MTMRATGAGAPGRLPVGEQVVLDKVGGRSGGLAINKANGKTIKSLADRFSSAMNGEHRNVFYRANTAYVLGGLALSILVVVLLFLFGNIAAATLLPVLPFAFVGAMLTFILIRAAQAGKSGFSGKIRFVFMIFFAGMFLANAGVAFGDLLTGLLGRPLLIGALASLVAVNVLFFFLMGAPTPLGASRSAEIEGLKLYLSVAEEERMNMLGSPDMSPQHYETLLPYAVALGVERS